MLKKTIVIIVAVVVIAALTPVNSESQWKTLLNKKGIVVYGKKVKDSKFWEVVAITTIKTSLFSLIRMWEDVGSYPEWFHSCAEGRLVKKVGRLERYIYLVTDSPSPLQDRDNILHVLFKQNKESRVVEILLKGIPDYLPEKKKFVRVPRTYGKVTLKPQADGNIKVIFNLFLDPGGLVPFWLVNSFSEDFYFKTLKNMREKVIQEKYQKHDYPFLLNYPE
ncbi:MAG: START domain-containing protein [Leptospirales bacterium]